MTDRPRRARPGPPRPVRPKPVLDSARGDADTAESPLAADSSGKPTPVRTAPRDVVDPTPEVVRFLVGGVPWLARVLGRAGAAAGRAPLLLVGFDAESPDAEASGQGQASTGLESWIVGTDLGSLSETRLGEHLRSARPRDRRKSDAADGRRRRNG